jgi:hypothetical protein
LKVTNFRLKPGELLAPAERFTAAVYTQENKKGGATRLAAKAGALLFVKQFETHVAEVRSQASTLVEACKAVLESEKLSGVFHCILEVGNILNEGKGSPHSAGAGAAGGGGFEEAAGFTLDSILKLIQTKSTVDKVRSALLALLCWCHSSRPTGIHLQTHAHVCPNNRVHPHLMSTHYTPTHTSRAVIDDGGYPHQNHVPSLAWAPTTRLGAAREPARVR